MPSDSPTHWTTTLREHGRLVLRPRRDKLGLSLFVTCAVLLVNGTRTVGQLSSGADWDFFAYVRTTLAVGAAIALLMILNNLRTNHWTLVVTSEDVTLGRRRLAWSDITRVTSAKEQVVLHPASGTEELRITNNTLRDPKAFALWLTTELETRT